MSQRYRCGAMRPVHPVRCMGDEGHHGKHWAWIWHLLHEWSEDS